MTTALPSPIEAPPPGQSSSRATRSTPDFASRPLAPLARWIEEKHGADELERIVLKALENYTYDEVFAGQLKAILAPGDLVVAISGSGNSKNVVKAVEYANQAGAETLAIVGYDGGTLKKIARHCVWVPSFDMQLCEDLHLMFGHMVMKTLCGSRIED